MEVHGIKFNNRTKTRGYEAEDPAKKCGPFVLFASLCVMYGVARFVRGVEYSSNSGAYWIDAEESIADHELGGLIALAADATLPSYFLFDVAGHKGMLGDDGSGDNMYDA